MSCIKCGSDIFAKSMCRQHYDQARHSGEIAVKSWSKSTSPQDRFWDKIDRSAGPDGCWPWTGSLTHKGYGKGKFFGESRWSHRVAYCLGNKIDVEELPSDIEIDHSCGRRSCCNPLHLRMATHKQNLENLSKVLSSTGFRGVSRNGSHYKASVTHHGVQHYLGTFKTATEAAEVARKKRNELFTHNDLDRKAG